MKFIFLILLVPWLSLAQGVAPPFIFSGANIAQSSAAASFTYYSVDFDGADYLSRGVDMTGVNNGASYTCSFWMKLRSSSSYVISFNSYSYAIYYATPTILRARDALGIATFEWASAPTGFWCHYLVAVNAGGTSQIYTNDVVAYSGTDIGAGNLSLTAGDVFLFSTIGGAAAVDGLVSEFWWATNSIDISQVSNRRKFISANLHPESLGADGSTPTGSQPAIYLHNSFSTFQNNLGYGGTFTLSGTLGDGGADLP